MQRTMIGKVEPCKSVKIQGFVEHLRDKKSMQFLVVRDITGSIQVTIEKEKLPEIAEKVSGLLVDSVVTITGEVLKSEFVKLNGMELIPTSLEVESYSEALPIAKDSSIDQKMDYRWIDLRDPKNIAIFKISTFIEKCMRDYMINCDAIEIHTPKISVQSSEGGSEVFKVDYFGQPAFLTQSPQLYKQMAMSAGFEKVFEIGPYYRAESSFTNRHATEFMGFDVEMSYIESHHDVMDLEEGLIKYVLERVSQNYGDVLENLFNTKVVVPTNIPRLKFKDVVEILEKEYGYKSVKNDLDQESEKLIGKYVLDKYNSEFVFVTDYPFEARAFYSMKCEEDPKYTKSFDLIWNGQEITSGAQREHRYNVLKSQIEEKGINRENMKDYLEFFKYGCPPHGGLGLGLARFFVKLLNLQTIKEVCYIFRGPNRIKP